MAGGAGSIFDGASPLSSPTALLLFQMIFIILTCATLGKLLGWVRQPRVVAEVIGGILLGPTALGQIPGYMENIFPPESLGHLKTLAEIGLIFFLFIVGLEMDFQLMTKNVKQSCTIAIVSTAIPFATGWLMAWLLVLILPNEITTVSFGTFGLFVAVCFCITAFPVLARILSAFHLTGASIGVTALSAAAISDVIAWGLLALVVAIAGAGAPITALYVVVCNGAFAISMFLVVRPALTSLLTYKGLGDNTREGDAKPQPISYMITAIIFVLVLAASWVTQILGVDAIFGAFITGLIVPRMQAVPVQLMEVTEPLVNIVLLPLYFAYSGLNTDLTLLNTGIIWGMTVLVVITVTICKVLPVMTIYRWFGGSWGDAVALGFLMNTKGLVELIVLNIGLQANIISPTIFGILVLMSLVTTFITSPIVSALCHPTRSSSALSAPDETISGSAVVAAVMSLVKGSLNTSEINMVVHVEDKFDTTRFSQLIKMLMVPSPDIQHKIVTEIANAVPVTVGRFQVRESVGAPDAPRLTVAGDLSQQTLADSISTTNDVEHTNAQRGLDAIDAAKISREKCVPPRCKLKLCAIHIVATDDTYAGITYATSYFPNTRAVTDFQALCDKFDVPSYPFVALNHDGERSNRDELLAEVARLQQGVNTILLTWDRTAAIHDPNGLNTCALLKRKVNTLSRVMRTCVYIDTTGPVEHANRRRNYGQGHATAHTSPTKLESSVELTMLVPFLGGADSIEATILAVQICKATQGVQTRVCIVDYRSWLKPKPKKAGEKNCQANLATVDILNSPPNATIIEIQGDIVTDVYDEARQSDCDNAFLDFMHTYAESSGSVQVYSPDEAELNLIRDTSKRVGRGDTSEEPIASCANHFASLTAVQKQVDPEDGDMNVLAVCGAEVPSSATVNRGFTLPDEVCVEGQFAALLYDTGFNTPLLSVRACDAKAEERSRCYEEQCC